MLDPAVDPNDPRLRPVPPREFSWNAIPASKAEDDIVKVSMIPSSDLDSPRNILINDPANTSRISIPSFSFLIQHEKNGTALLWDLGMTKNEKLTPVLRDGILKTFRVVPGQDVISRLTEKGFNVTEIEALVLSHSHFDHIGDFDTLPSETRVICGPGTLEAMRPGYPEDEQSEWWSKWFEERELVQLPSTDVTDSWTASIGSKLNPRNTGMRWQKLACYEHAVDWFGDGSFWIVNTPGHRVGHISALARVTSNPDTYVFLAGDTSHHQSLYLPVPTEGQPDTRTKVPFYPKSEGSKEMTSLDDDPIVNTQNIGRLTRLSAEDNIMVLLAHEGEVEGILPVWPEDLSRWKTRGWKEEKEEELKGNIARAKATGARIADEV
ncbi:hypothetical protein QFC21_001669 [Naganishia friedmannii]|uniref:Uncharacterized protein n=1 Tax=Naganishia friedmannii TaxID=89922 RepID=A0ACC2W2K6_9TREE|nr:hypothetical protein QFC21_001669 [Naganishia friedmannii]